MKKVIIVLLIVVAAVALYFLFFSGERAEEDPIIESLEFIEKSESITIELLEQNESGQSGFAVIEDVEVKIRVTIQITSGEEGVSQPAHIHFNNCADIEAVSYPLNNVLGGYSETFLNVSMDQIMSERPLSINVRRSMEVAFYVACGDI